MTKDDFILAYRENIQRRGAENLLEWMLKSDFFTAPASTRFHLAIEGGLFEHSWNTYRRLQTLMAREYPEECPYSDETVAICGLLHDICKANLYKIEMRNVKINNKWEQKPYYTIEEQIPFGHGEKSVFIIERFMRLKLDEAIAIRYHMGGFDVKQGDYSLSKAFEQYPLAVLLHTADLHATYLDEQASRESE
ncbi:MAG: hydrolase [Oscillospiraceae bacterium]